MSETQKSSLNLLNPAHSTVSFLENFSSAHSGSYAGAAYREPREITSPEAPFVSTTNVVRVLPRGMKPEVIRAHVQSAVPYLFLDAPVLEVPGSAKQSPILEVLQKPEPTENLSHVEYYELCLAAHWATAGSFLPIDVIHQIRFRLWSPALSLEQLNQMIDLTLEARFWPTENLTRRSTQSGLSSHGGDWLAVAVAAYGASRDRLPLRAETLLEQIQFEVTREAKIYCEVKRRGDGVELLKVAALIAHNLGDLDRSCEEWALSAEDPLMATVYRAAHEEGDAHRFNGALYEAGLLNKALMASENHRHLMLRMPKNLRRSPDFLIPIGPFFDDLGATLARDPSLEPRDYQEIVEALLIGWEKLKGSHGKTITYAYPRAIASLIEHFPGGIEALSECLTPDLMRSLRSGLFRSLISVSKERFEDQWNFMAMNFVHGKARKFTPPSLLHTVGE